jgi:DNA polymerase (family 10)
VTSDPLIERAAETPEGLDARAVAALLVEIGRRLVLAGESPYKARAYARAAESLALLSEPLETVIAADRLRELPGVGIALAETIRQLHRDGTTPRLEAMRAEVPTNVLALLAIPGLRPSHALDLYRELGIASVAELEAACRQDRLKSATGFVAAFQAKMRKTSSAMKAPLQGDIQRVLACEVPRIITYRRFTRGSSVGRSHVARACRPSTAA